MSVPMSYDGIVLAADDHPLFKPHKDALSLAHAVAETLESMGYDPSEEV